MISYKNIYCGVHPGSFRRQKRRGAVVVLAAILMVFMIALLAFTIDLGYLLSARTEMQRTADAAALAGALEMARGDFVVGTLSGVSWDNLDGDARQQAVETAALNQVINTDPALKLVGDIDLGYRPNPIVPTALEFLDPSECNIVRVRLRYGYGGENKPISFFFAPVLGIFSADLSVEAAATFSSDDPVGFRVTEKTGNSTLLPFAVKGKDWKDLVDGNGAGGDAWTVDPETGAVSPGPDGIRELTMYPQKETGSTITPGNFGTIDIGDANNSAPDIWRQIRDGPSPQDFSHYDNNELKLDPHTDTLSLNGDTGITTSMKAPLDDIIGQPRTISLYKTASGQGDQTDFTIEGFAGVRVVDSKLVGNNKYILIQPSNVSDPTAIVDSNDDSDGFVTRVYLVRY